MSPRGRNRRRQLLQCASNRRPPPVVIRRAGMALGLGRRGWIWRRHGGGMHRRGAGVPMGMALGRGGPRAIRAPCGVGIRRGRPDSGRPSRLPRYRRGRRRGLDGALSRPSPGWHWPRRQVKHGTGSGCRNHFRRPSAGGDSPARARGRQRRVVGVRGQGEHVPSTRHHVPGGFAIGLLAAVCRAWIRMPQPPAWTHRMRPAVHRRAQGRPRPFSAVRVGLSRRCARRRRCEPCGLGGRDSGSSCTGLGSPRQSPCRDR